MWIWSRLPRQRQDFQEQILRIFSMKLQFWQRRRTGCTFSSLISVMHLWRSESVRRRRAVSFLRRNAGSQLIMKLDTRSCSICFRMWDRFTAYPSFRQAEPADIRCRFRRRMICSIQRDICFRKSQFLSEDVLLRKRFLMISQRELPRISSRQQRLPNQWSRSSVCLKDWGWSIMITTAMKYSLDVISVIHREGMAKKWPERSMKKWNVLLMSVIWKRVHLFRSIIRYSRSVHNCSLRRKR